LRVKQSFFNFFLLTLNNYLGYFKSTGDESVGGQKTTLMMNSSDIFDFKGYMEQFKGSEFMERLIST